MRRSGRVRKEPSKLLDTYNVYKKSVVEQARDLEDGYVEDDNASTFEDSQESSSDSEGSLSEYDSDSGKKVVGDDKSRSRKKRVIRDIIELEIKINDIRTVKENLSETFNDLGEKYANQEYIEESESSDDEEIKFEDKDDDGQFVDILENEVEEDDDDDDDASDPGSGSDSGTSEDEFERDYTIKRKSKKITKDIFDDKRLYGDHVLKKTEEDDDDEDESKVTVKQLKKLDDSITAKQRQLKESLKEPDLEDLVDNVVKELELNTDDSRFESMSLIDLVNLLNSLNEEYQMLEENVKDLREKNAYLSKLIRERKLKEIEEESSDSEAEDDYGDDDDDEIKDVVDDLIDDMIKKLEDANESESESDDDNAIKLKRDRSRSSNNGGGKRVKTGVNIKSKASLTGLVVGKNDTGKKFFELSKKNSGVTYEGIVGSRGKRIAIFMATPSGEKWLKKQYKFEKVPSKIKKLY